MEQENKNNAAPDSPWAKWIDRFSAFTLILAGTAGAIILLVWLTDQPGEYEEGPIPPGLGEAEFASIVNSGQRLGNPRAPVELVVYQDYRCGFCLRLHHTLEKLRARYPQHLAVIYKHFVDRSSPAGRDYLVPLGVECAAEQGIFERYHRMAYENTHALEDATGPWVLAETASIPDSSAFSECVTSRRYAERVRAQYEEAQRLGVRATPTMFLNGRLIVGTLDLPALDSLIAMELPR